MISGPWNPGFQDSRSALELASLGLISTCRVLIPLSLCQETWFSTQNFKISSLLETSRNVLELWILPGNGQFFADSDMLGINSTLFLWLNMNLASKNRKMPIFTIPLAVFYTLDSRHPEIQKGPGISQFRQISKHGVFFPLTIETNKKNWTVSKFDHS